MAKIKLENLRIHRNENDRSKSFYWDITTRKKVKETDPGFPKPPFYIPEETCPNEPQIYKFAQVKSSTLGKELLAAMDWLAWFRPTNIELIEAHAIEHEFFIAIEELERIEKKFRKSGHAKAADQARQLFADLEDCLYIHVIDQ